MRLGRTWIKYFFYFFPRLFLSLVFCSCTPKLSPVKIISVDGMKARDLLSTGSSTLDIKLNNSNGVGFTMKQISFDVFVNDKVIASVNEEKKFRVKRKSDFNISLNVKTSGDLSSYMDLGMDLFSNKKFKLGVKGIITARKFIFNTKVPVDLTTKDFNF